MNDSVLEASANILLNSEYVDDILNIVWHVGEPLAVGLDYYKNAVNCFNKYNKRKIKLFFSIQTNGTLINQEWCDFFKENNFQVNISIDGPQFIHDKYRQSWNGKGSFENVMKGVECFNKNNIALGAIVVLTRESLEYSYEIYNFFKENNFKQLSFNIEEVDGDNIKSSFQASKTEKNDIVNIIEEYRSFNSKLFDLWIRDNRSISIKNFEDAIKLILIKKTNPEDYIINAESLGFSMITIAKNGDISTFSPELSGGVLENPQKFTIGNILKINKLNELLDNINFKNQQKAIEKGIENCFLTCKYYDVCGGGAPSNKFYEKGTFEATETLYCLLTKKTLMDVVMDSLEKRYTGR